MSHLVSEPVLRQLGRTGFSDQAAAVLVAGQHSKRLLLLRSLLDRAHSLGDVQARIVIDAHWRLLEAAERADPSAVHQVLHYPTVGGWAERSLRRLHAVQSWSCPQGHADLSHFGAMAAAAALNAGTPFQLLLDTRPHRTPNGTDGTRLLALPALGAVSHAGTGPILLTSAGGRLTLRGPNGGAPVAVQGYGAAPAVPRPATGPQWLPLHRLPGTRVVLDDLDPFRALDDNEGGTRRPAEARLPPARRFGWQRRWRDAMALLDRVDSQRSAEVATLVRVVVPLVRRPPQADTSATSTAAFGAVFTTLSSTTAGLAATLVHEAQHNKLAALLDLVPLFRGGRQASHWAPWRPDPRPFHALLQGAYAHLALADFWRRAARQAERAGDRENASWEYARCWEQVSAVLPRLSEAAELTVQGRLFVAGMAAKHHELTIHPPPEEHRAAAAAEVGRAHRRWQRRYGTDTW